MWQRLVRVFKHRWQSNAATRQTIPTSLLDKLAARVEQSESGHSGEIRIYVEAALPTSYLWLDLPMAQVVRRRALSMFGKLRVWDTQHNNGVLIYLLLVERRLEIVADRGLNNLVSVETWQHLAKRMELAFKAGDFELGLTQAVDEVTTLLQQHFALDKLQRNPNELPNSPVLG